MRRSSSWFRLSVIDLITSLSILLLAATDSVSADTLDKTTVETVSNATYEVVLLKPTNDPLTYERPLPLDLIPYAERTDPYYSIGTAFALGPTRLVSAAHVFGLGFDSQWKTIRLRDRQGQVHEIDQIHKYSMHRDFVVFSIKSKIPSKGLETNTTAHLNDKVYAVGNALGEGIVIRDGLYTSDTPEEQDGRWKWMRFSAAASPGNSGGPLLDRQGRVVGIVLRKSENENLNFALPVAEVLNSRGNYGEVDSKVLYFIDNMSTTFTDRLRKEFKLPKSYPDLDTEIRGEMETFGDKIKSRFFAREREKIFPEGAGSLQVLNSSYSSNLPGIISQGNDGQWDVFFPDKPNTSDLGKNGTISYGTLGNSLMLNLRKPDGVRLDKLYRDSTEQMNLLLRGIPVHRQVGVEKIKITSLGKAQSDEFFTDSYGRRWIVRSWNLPHSNQKMVLFALPTPGGFVGALRLVPTERYVGIVSDMKVLADFTYLSYYGTLEQWEEFLQARDLLPPVFGTLNIDFEYNRRFRYASKRVAFAYGPEQMPITPRSDLELRFAFFRENGKTVWDVRQVLVGESKDRSTYFAISRNQQPPRELDDKFRSKWDDITQRRHPYNKSAYFDNKRTLIGDVYTGVLRPEQLNSAPLLYTTFFSADGNVAQKDLEIRLKGFVEKLSVKEY